MTTTVNGNASHLAAESSSNVSEAEAALYDRQIRLWGLEAQNRMRRANILLYSLGGIATETVKNIVLAGVGSVTILDDQVVTEEDLGAGFFFRGADVGHVRVTAAAPRIQALNPLVKVHTATEPSVLQSAEALGALNVDAIIATKGSRNEMIALSKLARSLSIKFYAASSQGLHGWIFSDLGRSHEYILELDGVAATAPPLPSEANGAIEGSDTATQTPAQLRADPPKQRIRKRQGFVPLEEALQMQWRGKTRKEFRELKLSIGLFATWALWELQETAAPAAEPELDTLVPLMRTTAEKFMIERGVQPSTVYTREDPEGSEYYHDLIQSTLLYQGDFAPTTAILGGVLAQDLLNALGGRQAPLCNWFQLNGAAGNGPVHALCTPKSEVIVP